MTINELKFKRNRIEDRLKTYHRKHYDGRAILKAYQVVTKILQESGRNVGLIPHDYTSEKYWELETSRNREHLNKNPIIGVDENYDFVWKYGPPGVSVASKKRKKIIDTPIIAQVKESNPAQNKYYRINIEWDSDIPDNIHNFILNFFDDMGLETITASNNSKSFKFIGTDEGLMLIKRAAIVSLDILSESPINIGIYSEIIT